MFFRGLCTLLLLLLFGIADAGASDFFGVVPPQSTQLMEATRRSLFDPSSLGFYSPSEFRLYECLKPESQAAVLRDMISDPATRNQRIALTDKLKNNQALTAEESENLRESILNLHDSLQDKIEGPTPRSKAALKRLADGAEQKPEYPLGDHFTYGLQPSFKVVSYDLAAKKASVAEGAGMGFQIRWYPTARIGNIEKKCRVTTFNATTVAEDSKEGKIDQTALWFSLSPTIYASKTTSSSDITVQPALVLSAFRDLIHIGTGFNLSGPQQGHVFVVFAIGAGFALK
jgi:hypothetical protein